MTILQATASDLSRQDQARVFLVSVGHGMTHWVKSVIFVLLPAVREDFSLDYTDIGLFGTIYYMGGAISNLSFGPLVDLTGRRELFQVLSLLLMVVAMAVIGMTDSYTVFLAMAVLIAAGSSLWHPAAIPYLSSRYSSKRGYVLAIHSFCANIGDSAAPAVVGAMISGWFIITFSWREAVVWNMVPVLMVLPVIVIFVLLEPQPEEKKASKGMALMPYLIGLWAQLKSPMVIGLSVVAGLRSTAQGGLRLFLPVYMVDVGGLPLAYAGLALMALSVGGSITAIPAGIASDRYGRRPVVMVALGISTVLIAGFTLIENEFAMVGGVCLIGFSIYALRPVMISWILDITPDELGGSATNLLSTVQSLFNSVMPFVAGLIATKYGLVSVFYLFAVLLMAANVVAYFLPKDHGK
jgi:MFS family permease